jgi:hypothetical protein
MCLVVLLLFMSLILFEINYLKGIISVFSLDTFVFKKATVIILNSVDILRVLMLPVLSLPYSFPHLVNVVF